MKFQVVYNLAFKTYYQHCQILRSQIHGISYVISLLKTLKTLHWHQRPSGVNHFLMKYLIFQSGKSVVMMNDCIHTKFELKPHTYQISYHHILPYIHINAPYQVGKREFTAAPSVTAESRRILQSVRNVWLP